MAKQPGCNEDDPAYLQYKKLLDDNAKIAADEHEKHKKELEQLKKKKDKKSLARVADLESLISTYQPKPSPKDAKTWCCDLIDGPLVKAMYGLAKDQWTHKQNQMHDGGKHDTSGWQLWEGTFTHNNQPYTVEAHVHFVFPQKGADKAEYNNGPGHHDNFEIKANGQTVCDKRKIGNSIHRITGLADVNQADKNKKFARQEYDDIYTGNIVGYDTNFYSRSDIDGIEYNYGLDDGYMNNYQYGYDGSWMIPMFTVLIVACIVCCICFIGGGVIGWMTAKCAKSQGNKRRMPLDVEINEI